MELLEINATIKSIEKVLNYEKVRVTFYNSDSKKEIKQTFNIPYFKNYLDFNKLTSKGAIGLNVTLTMEPVEFISKDTGDLIRYNKVKYFNFLDENGKKIFYKKDNLDTKKEIEKKCNEIKTEELPF